MVRVRHVTCPSCVDIEAVQHRDNHGWAHLQQVPEEVSRLRCEAMFSFLIQKIDLFCIVSHHDFLHFLFHFNFQFTVFQNFKEFFLIQNWSSSEFL